MKVFLYSLCVQFQWLLNRAIFNWVSRLLWFCIATRYVLNQSVVKSKPIVTYLHVFSRAWRRFQVSTLSSDWFIGLLACVVITLIITFRVITLVLVLRHLNENFSKQKLWCPSTFISNSVLLVPDSIAQNAEKTATMTNLPQFCLEFNRKIACSFYLRFSRFKNRLNTGWTKLLSYWAVTSAWYFL